MHIPAKREQISVPPVVIDPVKLSKISHQKYLYRLSKLVLLLDGFVDIHSHREKAPVGNQSSRYGGETKACDAREVCMISSIFGHVSNKSLHTK